MDPLWMGQLDERQRKEIKLARFYATECAHGTTGHNQLILIAKMADLLDAHEANTPLPSNEDDGK